MEVSNQPVQLQQLQKIKDLLSTYHGATKLQNIPEFTSSLLYKTLIASTSIDISLTVHEVIQRITSTLSAESIILQFAKFQEEKHKNIIIPSQRLPENQRLAFYASKNTHEWLEMIFSPTPYYFTLARKSFRL
ncbi:MAG: hypothetical protein WCL18_04440 [bacterium]